MCNVSNDYEWKTVPYKSSRRRTPRTASLVTSPKHDNDEVSVEVLESRVQRAMVDLKRSEFCQAVMNLLKPFLEVVEELLCYGLGSPSASSVSIHQLALLSTIRGSRPCSVYDPVFNSSDLKLLKRFHIDPIARNEKCCRELTANTLVYMPHCDLWMYNNFLWANWSADNLRRVTLLGNSFKSILERVPSRRMVTQYEYIFLAGKWDLFEESVLPSWEERDSVFNDTAVVTFHPSVLYREFTRLVNPPLYDDEIM